MKWEVRAGVGVGAGTGGGGGGGGGTKNLSQIISQFVLLCCKSTGLGGVLIRDGWPDEMLLLTGVVRRGEPRQLTCVHLRVLTSSACGLAHGHQTLGTRPPSTWS